MKNSSSCWLVVQKETFLFLQGKDLALPTTVALEQLTPFFVRQFALGCSKDITFFAAEVSSDMILPDALQAVPVRQALTLLPADYYGMVVKAYSVIRWDKHHQFCGQCAAQTMLRDRAFERYCQACGLSCFPRISPSIIVLIHRGEELLMASSPHYAPGVYGLIAGFIEAGESAEDALHREVFEEVGIKVQNPVYFGSQPWPFPDSLMLAYTAEYASGDIVICENEIKEAGWYRYDKLPGLPSSRVSIAFKLLDHFINSHH